MPDTQPVVRLYNEADDAMRQRQRTLREHYIANADAFQGLNPAVFTPNYAERWDTSQNAADTAEPGTVRAATLHEDTEAVEAKMQQARSTMQRLFYAVGQAYPGNAGRLNQFGKNRYEQARDSHDHLITLLDLAHDTASRPADAEALAKHGWTAAATTQLETLGQELAGTNTTQEAQKGTGVETGQGYVGLQNALYRFGQQASLAAKTVFADDFAKRQLFDLTDGGGEDTEDHELTVKPGAEKSVLFTTPLTPETVVHLFLSKSEAGRDAQVGRVAQPDATPTSTVALTAKDRSIDVPAASLGPDGQWLVVRNPGERTVRVLLRVVD